MADEQLKGRDLLRYRPHIDGLRAIAIIAVVGNHTGLPGFSGGYVGVDVFFVISGFLIITQIAVGLNEGTFRFGDFWSRRALRILPPMLLVLVATVAIGAIVDVTLDQFVVLGQEALSSALMGVNFFLLQRQGYFDDFLSTKPFLHLWSLAVEEQFYLFAPLILAAGAWLYRRQRTLSWILVTAAFFASFAACIYFSRVQPPVAFFMMPTRAWEFIAGGCLALALPVVRNRRFLSSGVLGIAGLILIVACTVLLRADSSYPSYFALAPVLGSSLLIVEGLAFPGAPSARLLSSKPAVWIGLISYSWYLWHWPLLVFVRQYQFGSLSLVEGTGLAVVSLALATATYVLVERPIRLWRQRGKRRLGWRPALGGIATCALVGVALLATTAQLASTAARNEFDLSTPNAGPCMLDVMTTVTGCSATLGGKRLGLLLGDSHAQAAYGTYESLAEARGSKLATLAIHDCPPFLLTDAFKMPTRTVNGCVDGHARSLSFLSDPSLPLDYAILASHWELYVGDGLMPNGAVRHGVGLTTELTRPEDHERAFVAGLRATFDMLNRRGVRRILVVASAPDLQQVDCIPRAEKMKRDADIACSEPRTLVDANRAMAMRLLKEATAGYPNVRLADPIGAFCDNKSCVARWQTLPLYYDTDHLRPSGEILLTNYLRDDFDWVMGADAEGGQPAAAEDGGA